ncbi:NADPH-dependent FMN reductase [Oribacterium sp. C9]|uniref:flavodoxin family protein n=1 Tax=Oribacterium sp. C9 TaxID=1943579 RepID=UPI00098F4D5F|nr:flavodoxin family protein [Oribacterium sp. C9]OON84734.1 NADPH-dependent FMN reductase [Oribacterium sp. C9]
MKVLIINGSPRAGGNTSIALDEMVKVFEAEGVETEVVQVGNKDIRGCIACLDRLFYSTGFDKTMKVGASVVCARRGGLSAAFDELNKYFTICGMPVASSQYWNSIHGREKGQAREDFEGLQTMRTLARNMTFLMKSIALGKEKYGLPEKEEWLPTHFIR